MKMNKILAPNIKRKIVKASFAFAILSLSFLGWSTYREIRSMQTAEKWETHTYAVLLEFDKLLSLLKDVETGQRGFIITNNEKYLEPYYKAIGQVNEKQTYLKDLNRDYPEQQERLRQIDQLIAEKLKVIDQTIELRKKNGFEAAKQIVITDKGMKLMDDINVLVKKCQEEQRQLLQSWQKKNADDITNLSRTLMLGGIFSMIILILVFNSLNINIKLLHASETELLESNEALLRSNKDLEQFAYLTSHDLQEPLVTISTFTQSLAHKYKDNFDEYGQQLVRFIVENSLRMYGLINDLLTYSNLNAHPLKFKKISIDLVLKKVIHQMAFNIQKKKAEITFSALPSILGDEQLLIQLFQNLIDNAIKYCTDTPKIHICSFSFLGKGQRNRHRTSI